MPLLHYV